MSRFQVERRDNYILGLSLGRNLTNNGQPMVSVATSLSTSTARWTMRCSTASTCVPKAWWINSFPRSSRSNLTFEHQLHR